MKKLFFLLLITSALSCQSQIDQSKMELNLEKIAEDQDYIIFQQKFSEHVTNLNNGKYDLEKIYNIIDNTPTINSNPCSFGLDLFEGIKGGPKYRNLMCEIDQSLQNLNEKYNYASLSDEKRDLIRKTYYDAHGRPEVLKTTKTPNHEKTN